MFNRSKKDVNVVFDTYLVDLDAILELTSHRTPNMSVRHAGHLQTFSEKHVRSTHE